MDSTELLRFERRARRSYELGRARRAALGAAPLALAVLVAALIGERPRWAAIFGALAFSWAALLLWYGRDVRRAVLPGVAAGLIPLTLALCASVVGHGCVGDHCVALCLPACSVGGVAAGLLVAALGHRGRHGAPYWLSVSGIALLTGASGCACVGYAGLLSLAVGYAAGFAPGALRARLKQR